MLEPLHQKIKPHFWGVDSMTVESGALSNQTFSLSQGTFLFPDNTYARLNDNARLQPRSFETAWEDGGQAFNVYIGLKKFNPASHNVTVVEHLSDLTDVRTRFVTTDDSDDIRDMHSQGPTAQVRRMQLVLKLIWEFELDQSGDYELIPLAVLERSGDDVILSEEFAPPCLTIGGAHPLDRLVREVRDQISSRCRQLESYKRDRGIHTAEFGSRDMVFLLALRSLNRYVSQLIHITESAQVHPWVAYGILRQLMGELSTFSERVSVTGETMEGKLLLPPYNHQQLWWCFSSAQRLITHLLDEITAGPEYMITLLYDGTYYAADLQPAMFEGRNRYYLAIETESDPQALLQSIEQVAKVSSREYLPILIARALPGIRLEYLQVPPQELPRRINTLYFQIDHHNDQWNQVQNGNNLAMYWDTAPGDIKAELMIVGRS
ncbi:MAG: type VI secretion system baseplate subunit TssK [Proteobacteria bacterium]|nr:MAG: type VI secretion system baseplate subunit TssK [Pseudomonadota bacterium]